MTNKYYRAVKIFIENARILPESILIEGKWKVTAPILGSIAAVYLFWLNGINKGEHANQSGIERITQGIPSGLRVSETNSQYKTNINYPTNSAY